MFSVPVAKEFRLLPGQKLYTDFRKTLYSKQHGNDDNESDNIPQDNDNFVDSRSLKEDLNSSVSSFGCSPLKLVANRDRVVYGERKVNQMRKSRSLRQVYEKVNHI